MQIMIGQNFGLFEVPMQRVATIGQPGLVMSKSHITNLIKRDIFRMGTYQARKHPLKSGSLPTHRNHREVVKRSSPVSIHKGWLFSDNVGIYVCLDLWSPTARFDSDFRERGL